MYNIYIKPVRYFHSCGRLPTTIGRGVYLCITILITLSTASACVCACARARPKLKN